MPPAYARRSYAYYLSEFERLAKDTEPSVLLFPDTFMNYHEPSIAGAAIQLIGHAGCAVEPGIPYNYIPSIFRCCGRPFISNGMLQEAVNHARHNVEFLFP